ncbi:MAG TPA: hypothetical protein DEF41_12340 [Desulfovibrio sp.]|uniref:Uncharacterized protein n=1 Tax=Nitratidesulfovibrio vulgaris (strain ATCC 29579 / DSM 644 / CCUG 34227 / NCIMB 8303 / VKM B-1760 / Hildenborough) TaxID=882 RepID=Q72BP3_NITV2|nr:hypothetical protein DVU_1591 [Nitratidesulfovibrio vulgaris str. Hildenborough]HBW16882.1 hypothetical protein [Desulfovibrio sp.]
MRLSSVCAVVGSSIMMHEDMAQYIPSMYPCVRGYGMIGCNGMA